MSLLSRILTSRTTGAKSISLTSEAFYAIVYELLVDREDNAQAVEDLKEFLAELAHESTFMGIPFSELHLIEEDVVAAAVTVENGTFLITLPKEYSLEISITINPDTHSLEVDTDPLNEEDDEFDICDDCEGDCDNCPEAEDFQDDVESDSFERDELEQAVEDARTQLLWAEEALQDVEDDVELARQDLLDAKRALEDFNQE